MAITLLWRGKVYGVPRGTLTRGQVATFKGVVTADANDAPMGIALDDAPTDVPPKMVDLYGEGSVIRDTTLTLDQNSLIYSDGAGGYTVTPTGADKAKVWVFGEPVGADSFVVRIYSTERSV